MGCESVVAFVWRLDDSADMTNPVARSSSFMLPWRALTFPGTFGCPSHSAKASRYLPTCSCHTCYMRLELEHVTS
jgi:hypothetical protein